MEAESPWSVAALGAARVALFATLFPLATALAYAIVRSPSTPMGVATVGLQLWALSVAVALGCFLAGGRERQGTGGQALRFILFSVASLAIQTGLAILIAGAASAVMIR